MGDGFDVTFSNNKDAIPKEVEGGWEFDDEDKGDMSMLIEEVKILKRPLPDEHVHSGESPKKVHDPAWIKARKKA